ncbi:MAG: lactate utilization protein [Sphaerochaeta sp.]|jgi:hypothetical protein|nr:lactate utilization protein [Sphaerochaeta sp.]MDX9914687.1 lactate utilization protein [Sphaerochaeta sp.]
MDQFKQRTQQLRVARTIDALGKNNIEGHFVPTIEEIIPTLQTMMETGSTVAVGGSASLEEAGVLAWLRSGTFTFHDRYQPNLGSDGVRDVFLKSFDADTYLASANAITEGGEIYCVDGRSNRTAAMLWGPRQVILVASWDKIVPDLVSAILRVKTLVAPANAMRLGSDTHCTEEGRCVRATCDPRSLMALDAGSCEHTLCSNYVVFSRQQTKGRMKVLIVGESLGY